MFTGTVAAATVLVASTAPRGQAGRSLGMLQMAVMMGSALGPVLGGTLADFFGYRAAFFCTAGLLGTAALIVLAFVREEFTARPAEGPLWRRIVPEFSVITRSRDLSLLVLVVAVVNLAGGAVMPILPLYIQSLAPEAGFLGTTTGAIIGARALAAAAAAAVVGRVSDRLGYQRVLFFCLLGGVVSHLLLILVRTAGRAGAAAPVHGRHDGRHDPHRERPDRRARRPRQAGDRLRPHFERRLGRDGSRPGCRRFDRGGLGLCPGVRDRRRDPRLGSGHGSGRDPAPAAGPAAAPARGMTRATARPCARRARPRWSFRP